MQDRHRVKSSNGKWDTAEAGWTERAAGAGVEIRVPRIAWNEGSERFPSHAV